MSAAKHVEATASGQLFPLGQRVYATGMSFAGFTAVKLRDGGAAGAIVAQTSVAGIHNWHPEVQFKDGLYAELSGTGTFSVWVM